MIILSLHDVMMLEVGTGGVAIDSYQMKSAKKLAGRYDTEQAAEIISECYRMLHWIESNVNEKLIFEQLLLSMLNSDKMPA
jgi:hypothetical protein